MTSTSEGVRHIYSKSAQRYDILLRAYKVLGVNLEKWRRAAISRLPQQSRPRILEVGIGTGKNLPHLISKFPDYEEIVGLDYTPEMLVRCRHQVKRLGWDNIRLKLGDARKLTKYVEGQFDLIISTYSLSIIPNSPKVLIETKQLMSDETYLLLLDCQKFKGLLRIYNPLAILLSTRLGGSNETYSIPVSNIANSMFNSVYRRELYSGLFYEDLYQGIKSSQK